MSESTHTQQPKPRDNFRTWGDPAYNDLRRIFSEPKICEVLTHDSFYEASAAARGNGRYIFAGMTVFKGQVAEILFKFFSGSGTQLQHILGNLFKNDYLTQLFDRWKLSGRVRCGDGFDVKGHRHIFVYAIFGYVSTLDESTRNWPKSRNCAMPSAARARPMPRPARQPTPPAPPQKPPRRLAR